jgi:Lysophospholipase catalytic domain.
MRPVALDALSTVLWPKYIFKQDTSIVDLYGAYLANTFFRQIKDSDSRQKATLSSLRDSIKEGSWPLPICTAVETSVDNHWVTFTPFEVGSDTLHFHIPTWAFGRKFSGGISTDYAPEQSLGYFMGIWGSALSGSIEDILGTLSGLNPLLMHTIKDALVTIGASDIRWAAIKIHNPLYGSPDSPHRKRNISELILMDGGYAYNIPITPLVKKERAVDIIIIMDASQGVHNGNQDFKKAIADISNQGIALPPIDFSTDINSSISIFADPTNPKVPTIIYIMPYKEDGFDPSFDPTKEFSTTYKTADFSYKESDIDKLTGLIRYSIASKKDTIIGTIKDVIAKK